MGNDTLPALWTPDAGLADGCRLAQYTAWLRQRSAYAGPERDYEALWRWSVEDIGRFWSTIADYFEVELRGEWTAAVTYEDVEHAAWFAGATVNYAEHGFRHATPDRPAFVSLREDGVPRETSWEELGGRVASLQARLRAAGVVRGDRVVAYLGNGPEAIATFLAVAGMGAVWSSCSPDFGAEAVRDRFEQLEPKVLVACDGYRYGGTFYDRTDVIEGLAEALPSVRLKIWVASDPERGSRLSEADWLDYTAVPPTDQPPLFEAVPFEHPLWVLFSSGTTGRPKAIVHGHGGCLLEHLKYLALQMDVRPGERFFWFTTTGWMMWNFLQASLLVGAVPVLYDGSPAYPDLRLLWRLAAKLPIQHFGTSAPFIHACLRERLAVGAELPELSLRSLGSTGAPLSAAGFEYVYAGVSERVWLASMSGGTDVCTAFAGGCPWKPVVAGKIQARALGCDLHAYNPAGSDVLDEVGELVVVQPMPSMPVAFWGEGGAERLHESYFGAFPGAWRHGDWIDVDAAGMLRIHGRSDATLNRQGVRIGTAEIYRVLAGFTEVDDGLIVHYVDAGGDEHMPLFLKLAAGTALDGALTEKIRSALREENSPRHVPTRVIAVADIPYTLSGKRLEAPVKSLFEGRALEEVANLGALRNPDALRSFAHLAAQT